MKAFESSFTDSTGKAFRAINRSESLVATYLLQCGHHFVHEPYGGEKGKNPDFLATMHGKRVLIEVKELSQTALDKRLERDRTHDSDTPGVSISHPFIIDHKENWATLREDVRRSAKQLVPHAEKVDFCLVLIGCRDGMADPPEERDLYATMFGDQRFQIRTNQAGDVDSTRIVYTASGALLKKEPERQHVSGVGFIKMRQPHDYHQGRYTNHAATIAKLAGLDFDAAWDWAFSIWEQHIPKIPNYAKNPEAVMAFIHAVSNPFAHRPLPAGLLTARWDRTDLPVKG